MFHSHLGAVLDGPVLFPHTLKMLRRLAGKMELVPPSTVQLSWLNLAFKRFGLVRTEVLQLMFHKGKIGRKAMFARRIAPSAAAGQTPPRQPDYNDEITEEQHEAIRRLADREGAKAEKRTLLYSPGW